MFLGLDEDNNRITGMIIGGVSKKEMFDIRYDNPRLITLAQRLVESIRDDWSGGKPLHWGMSL